VRTIPVLARLRGARGWTARDLARRADLADETISRIENGHQPSPRTIFKLAAALEMDFDELAALLTEEPDEVSA
jgi:transcriptional regulator with XRE-family HTH domain